MGEVVVGEEGVKFAKVSRWGAAMKIENRENRK